jgi:acetyl esterase/lipase
MGSAEQMKSVRDFAERDQRPIETVVYKTVDGQDLQLQMCRPDGWQARSTGSGQAGQKRAALVWIHGGGWTGGGPGMMAMHMKYSASRGAVGFAVQYRLMKSSGYKPDKKLSDDENAKLKAARMKEFMAGPGLADLVADCEDAIRYIRANAEELGIDPNKIVAIGDSAGAHLTSCLGTLADEDARVNAAIPCSSISDLTTGFGPPYVKPSPGLEGKELAEDPGRLERAKALSPVFNIEEDGPPFLILAGQHDWLKDEPANFYQALQQKGVDCEFILYATAKHAFIVYGYSASLKEITQALLDIDAFLVKRGFLEGTSGLRMPGGNTTDEVVADIADPFSDERILENEHDFPDFLTLSLQVKPPATFKGVLVEMPGCFGMKWHVNNGGHDFTARRMRQRGKQIKLTPEAWNDVRVSMGEDSVKITVGDQETEIPNTIRHTFVADKIILNQELGAEVRNVKIIGRAE